MATVATDITTATTKARSIIDLLSISITATVMITGTIAHRVVADHTDT